MGYTGQKLYAICRAVGGIGWNLSRLEPYQITFTNLRPSNCMKLGSGTLALFRIDE